MADVGCHWSRQLPSGRMVYLSTWQTPHDWGHPDKRSGYSLTINFDTIRYDTLEAALADSRLHAENYNPEEIEE